MVIDNGTYYGISKDWYEGQNFNGVPSLSLNITKTVTTIGNYAFRDSWSTAKQNKGVITDYNYDGDKKYIDKYEIVSIDFSNATNLTNIGDQAAMSCTSLGGVLDLSGTKVVTIGKSAFNGCTGITGVILPSTLKELGSSSSGSVFNGCTGLKYVRAADSDSDAVFKLPDGLEVLGKQSFEGCTGLPENTTVRIPASVTHVGSEAFDATPSVSWIIVEADDVDEYDGKAFSNGFECGLGKRLTIFKDYDAYSEFKPRGSNAYKGSLTFEFTLHYGGESDTDAMTEKKLYGQAVNVCKEADGEWHVDDDYSIPPCTGDESVGYDLGWEYGGKILTDSTVLRPNADNLYLEVKAVLEDPIIEFVVDNEVINVEGTYPKLNLSNDEKHTIGVRVSHNIDNNPDADVKVRFEYEWTDVWKGGSQGPRMDEDGFGRYSLWDNPDVSNVITISGSTHERTMAGQYSGEDYGDGYYLLEIYGYCCPKNGGSWELFYKSASTVIGSDPDRTVDTAYMFDVVTSDPAVAPEVSVDDVAAEHGYCAEDVVLEAEFTEQDGHEYQYQWYAADQGGSSTGGEAIDGATLKTYTIPVGKDVGFYHYYVVVTAKKISNGDEAVGSDSATFTVIAHSYEIIIEPTGHGSYAASVSAAPEGTAVTITASPDEGYHAEAPTVIDSFGEALHLEEYGSGWQFTMPSSDVTVSGSFGLNEYTITFIVNGCEYWANKQKYGETIVLPEDEPSMSGFTFRGWSGYYDGMTVDSDHTFVAVFEPAPSPPEIVPMPPWDDDPPVFIPPNVVVEEGKHDSQLWIFIVLGSVATLLFLLFVYFERRDEEE